jgi:hypothetical protein
MEQTLSVPARKQRRIVERSGVADLEASALELILRPFGVRSLPGETNPPALKIPYQITFLGMTFSSAESRDLVTQLLRPDGSVFGLENVPGATDLTMKILDFPKVGEDHGIKLLLSQTGAPCDLTWFALFDMLG